MADNFDRRLPGTGMECDFLDIQALLCSEVRTEEEVVEVLEPRFFMLAIPRLRPLWIFCSDGRLGAEEERDEDIL